MIYSLSSYGDKRLTPMHNDRSRRPKPERSPSSTTRPTESPVPAPPGATGALCHRGGSTYTIGRYRHVCAYKNVFHPDQPEGKQGDSWCCLCLCEYLVSPSMLLHVVFHVSKYTYHTVCACLPAGNGIYSQPYCWGHLGHRAVRPATSNTNHGITERERLEGIIWSNFLAQARLC